MKQTVLALFISLFSVSTFAQATGQRLLTSKFYKKNVNVITRMQEVLIEQRLNSGEYLLGINLQGSLWYVTSRTYNGKSLISGAEGEEAKLAVVKVKDLSNKPLILSFIGTGMGSPRGLNSEEINEKIESMAEAYLMDSKGQLITAEKEYQHLSSGSTLFSYKFRNLK